MKLIQYQHPLNQTLSELSEWFRNPFVDFEPFSHFFGDRVRDVVSGNTRLAADLYEDTDRYIARFHLPGATKEEIQVHLESDADLFVDYQEKVSENDQDGNREPVRGSRHISLPKDADPAAVDAKLADGVLTVTVGKSKAAQPRTIEIS